jgi:hypothetical protein
MSGPFGSSQWMYNSGGAFYPYEIEQSLRFNDDDQAYLNRTPASASNRKTWTYSAWVKRGNLGPSSSLDLLVAGSNAFGQQSMAFRFDSDKIVAYGTIAGGSEDISLVTNAVYRDTSAWYHIVLECDTTQATASDRVKLYVNGEQVTSLSSSTYPAQNHDTAYNNTVAHTIGRFVNVDANRFDGYMAEVNFIDGTALDPTSFGETKSGIWVPKAYAGSYGTNGFYLSFADSAAIGDDLSGNGNDWTANNLVATDVLLDSPTNNYAVLNPLDRNGGVLSNGSLEYSGTYASGTTQNGHLVRSTLRVPPSGKWYVEASAVTIAGAGNSCMLGFTSSAQASTATAFGATLTPWIGADASVFNNSVRLKWVGVSGGTADATVLFASMASGDIINFAIDFDSGKIWIGKNGVYYNSGDPAAGTNETSTFTAGNDEWAFIGEYVAASTDINRSGVVANFGQSAFAYTPPTDFLPLNTANLPDPVIDPAQDDVPADYFNTVLWTGDGVTPRSFSGWGFSPDLIWLKGRSLASNHALIDKVRGTGGSILSSDTTSAENDFGLVVNSFDADGFTGATGSLNFSYANSSSQTYVGWGWLAGNGTASNTDGSITSTVSVNQKAGFSVVSYTGTGAASSGVTVGHGLGAAPAMIITKKRTGGTDYGWSTWHKDLGGNYGIWLDKTGARNPAMWSGYTNINTTVFSPPNLLYGNESGVDYINYLFAEVEGYSKFGSYTGNDSPDGPFIYLGFRPAFLILRNVSVSQNWHMMDNTRSSYNVAANKLYPNLSNAENSTLTDNSIDFLSNGFKPRGDAASNDATNGPSNTIIYMAFAESPFKYANAR